MLSFLECNIDESVCRDSKYGVHKSSTVHCLLFGNEQPRRAGGRAYCAQEVAGAGYLSCLVRQSFTAFAVQVTRSQPAAWKFHWPETCKCSTTAIHYSRISYKTSFWAPKFLAVVVSHYGTCWPIAYFLAHGSRHSCVSVPDDSVGATKILESLSFQTQRNKNQVCYLVIWRHVTVATNEVYCSRITGLCGYGRGRQNAKYSWFKHKTL